MTPLILQSSLYYPVAGLLIVLLLVVLYYLINYIAAQHDTGFDEPHPGWTKDLNDTDEWTPANPIKPSDLEINIDLEPEPDPPGVTPIAPGVALLQPADETVTADPAETVTPEDVITALKAPPKLGDPPPEAAAGLIYDSEAKTAPTITPAMFDEAVKRVKEADKKEKPPTKDDDQPRWKQIEEVP